MELIVSISSLFTFLVCRIIKAPNLILNNYRIVRKSIWDLRKLQRAHVIQSGLFAATYLGRSKKLRALHISLSLSMLLMVVEIKPATILENENLILHGTLQKTRE